jgi:outer membrane protein OmpA-like peptidoglycan-associated protein/tetratricopeptide (TPR) repeat protein
MWHRPYIIILLGLFMGWTPASGQKNIGNLFVSNTHKGDEMFSSFYYDQAVTFYKLALKKDETNNELKLKIANCYRMMNDYESSINWYGQVLNDSVIAGKPIDFYNYAEVLLTGGYLEEAGKWYKEYYKASPTDSRSYLKLNGLSYLQTLYRDSSTMEVNHIPINTRFDELAAIHYKEGLLFLSSRKSNSLIDDDFMREDGLLDIYYVAYDSASGWQETQPFDKYINTAYQEGPFTFFANKDKLILTRSSIVNNLPVRSKNGYLKLQLYKVTLEDGQWSKVEGLSINNPEYSLAHPSLTPGNDTLYFASDMAGGFGGIDLYMSVYREGDWSKPVNLGYKINTEGDEMYPFYLDNRLFFASNGRVGLGGLDIYKAFITDRKVEQVVNLGYPINSRYDDFAYYLDQETLSGTLTSNRPGGTGEADIYTFKYEAEILSGRVVQEQDGSPIFGALVKLIQDGRIVDTLYTNEDGLFSYYLPLTSDFELEVSKDNYSAALPVKVAPRQASIDLDTLRISLHKHDLFAEGRILNNETQKLMKDVRVVMYNLTDSKIDTLFTDENGTYSFVLEPNKEFSIYAGKSGFLVNGVDLNTKKISRGAIINDIVLELEYSKKNVVRFDFDKHNLTAASVAILNRLAKAMKNTNKHLVISAYADARGTLEYNQELSDRRATAILNYFIAQGIPETRITARGFGETLLLNRCTDGVDCEEIEHSKNRRAEIKIEGSTVR